MADNLNRNSYPNIVFLSRFGEIPAIKLVETFKNRLHP